MTNIHKLGFKRSPQEQPEIDQHKLPPLDLDYCPRCGEEIAEIIWGMTNCPRCGLHFECC